MSKTTIQLTDETKSELDSLKSNGESYESVVKRLLEGHEDTDLTESTVREIANSVVEERVTIQALQ